MNLIRTLRIKQGMTQGELADALGVTQGIVSQWETGRAFPNSRKIMTVAALLRVKPEVLIKESERRHEGTVHRKPSRRDAECQR